MRERPRYDAEGGPLELLTFAVLGSLVLAGAGVWLVGGVAGAIFGGGWPDVAFEDVPDVIGALSSHLGNPREAWPRVIREDLPGAVGFYAAAALVTTLSGLTVVGAILVNGRTGRRGRRGARWGSGFDLRVLRVRRPLPGRLILGRHGGRLLAGEPRQSVIVVAPTQSGKTTGLAIPALLEWDGPVLATSIKTDLVRDTLARREALGNVAVFDPTAVTGLDRAHWTPLGACTDWQAARETAARLCSVAEPGRGMSDADFWTAAAARYLAPLLYAAANGEHTITDVLVWIDTDQRDRIREILAGLAFAAEQGPGLRAAEAALAALEAVWEADDRLRSSVYSTAGVALDAYGDPTVAEASVRADLTPEWLLSGSNTAYLCATATGQERLRPLFVTLIDQVVDLIYTRAAETGKPIDPPLLLVLDEAANIAPLPRLDQLAATGAGQGLQLVTVVQDLAQIEARWGRRADTILNNHRAKLFGSGISCERTLSYLTRILGEEAVPLRSVSHTKDGWGTTTETIHFRAMAPGDRLRQSRPDVNVLVYGNLPPARVALRAWYADRDLRRLAGDGRAS